MATNLELLTELKTQVESLPVRNFDKLDAIRRRSEMLIRNIFGADHKYIEDLARIMFTPSASYAGMPESRYVETWTSGQKKLLNLVATMIEETELIGQKAYAAVVQHQQDLKISNRIFLVHGHDEEMKQSVARTISKLGLEPLILHEQPESGRTLIEKLIDHSSEVGYAVVLLSPDDVIREINNSGSTIERFRARQNVILELGLFLGKLGRTKVAVIYRERDNFDIPSDYNGVAYIPYDKSGSWAYRLGKELKAAQYSVDLNKL